MVRSPYQTRGRTKSTAKNQAQSSNYLSSQNFTNSQSKFLDFLSEPQVTEIKSKNSKLESQNDSSCKQSPAEFTKFTDLKPEDSRLEKQNVSLRSPCCQLDPVESTGKTDNLLSIGRLVTARNQAQSSPQSFTGSDSKFPDFLSEPQVTEIKSENLKLGSQNDSSCKQNPAKFMDKKSVKFDKTNLLSIGRPNIEELDRMTLTSHANAICALIRDALLHSGHEYSLWKSPLSIYTKVYGQITLKELHERLFPSSNSASLRPTVEKKIVYFVGGYSFMTYHEKARVQIDIASSELARLIADHDAHSKMSSSHQERIANGLAAAFCSHCLVKWQIDEPLEIFYLYNSLISPFSKAAVVLSKNNMKSNAEDALPRQELHQSAQIIRRLRTEKETPNLQPIEHEKPFSKQKTIEKMGSINGTRTICPARITRMAVITRF